jgi:DNA-binding NtrC family response regulator
MTIKTVLIVDDEFGIPEVLEAILANAGYGVVTAINGKQGLARLEESQPDVVLLDVMMPVLDGPGMVRAMQANAVFRDIPVIIMSSLPEAVVAESELPYFAFLRKPFRAAKVIQTIARAIESTSKGSA